LCKVDNLPNIAVLLFLFFQSLLCFVGWIHLLFIWMFFFSFSLIYFLLILISSFCVQYWTTHKLTSPLHLIYLKLYSIDYSELYIKTLLQTCQFSNYVVSKKVHFTNAYLNWLKKLHQFRWNFMLLWNIFLKCSKYIRGKATEGFEKLSKVIKLT